MRTTLIAAGLLGLAASPMACKRSGDTSSPSGECGGMCGRGTRCDGSVCVVEIDTKKVERLVARPDWVMIAMIPA